MKILWFTNTPSLGEERLKQNKLHGGGWIKSLEQAIKEHEGNDRLSVVYGGGDEDESFTHNGTDYYIVGKMRISKLKNKFANAIAVKENDDYQIKKYLKIIEKVKPDVIHIHGSENNYGLISKHVNLPIVMSIQGLLSVYQYKFFSGLNILDHRKSDIPASAFRLYYSYKRNSARELEMMKNINYFFGRTFWDKNITRLINSNSKYFLINRVIRQVFYHEQWKKERDTSKPIVLITTMRDNFYKGIETILKASLFLKNQNVPFVWNLIGINENSRFLKLFKKEYDDVKDCLKILGSVYEEGMLPLMQSSDVYVQTSHIENSPNGLAEAMLIGMPCIATYVGGTGSYIKQYHDGILIQDGDAWMMAATIFELFNNKELAVRLGQNAMITAHDRHNPQKIVQAILSAYQAIIEDFNA